MSNTALLEAPTTRSNHLRPVESLPAPAPSAAAERVATPRSAPLGFALYVGLDEQKAAAAGVSLGTLVEALRRTLADLAPDAETYATVALAPSDAGGRNVDLVRLALHEPSAVARSRRDDGEEQDGERDRGQRCLEHAAHAAQGVGELLADDLLDGVGGRRARGLGGQRGLRS